MRASMLFLSLLLCVSTVQAQQAKKEEKLLSKKEAVAIAEKFVVDKGYTLPTAGIPLQAKSVAARMDSDIWFVGFRSTIGDNIRGITVDAKSGSARLVSQNLKLDWLNAADADKPAAAPEKPKEPEKGAQAAPSPPKKAPPKKTAAPAKTAPAPAKASPSPSKKKEPLKKPAQKPAK